MEEFYLRYTVSHEDKKYGKEYLEFEFHGDGKMIYRNDSKYRDDQKIQKIVFVTQEVLDEIKRMIRESDIIQQDDTKWPERNSFGEQELEIVLDNYHISFNTCKILTFSETQKSKDPDGLKKLFYLVQDLKTFVLSIINLHFKKKPI